MDERPLVSKTSLCAVDFGRACGTRPVISTAAIESTISPLASRRRLICRRQSL